MRRELWKAALHREGWEPNEHSRICSAHFISGMYIIFNLEYEFSLKFCSIKLAKHDVTKFNDFIIRCGYFL